MKIFNEQEHPQLQTLNEMVVNVHGSLDKDIELSIYYNKLKHLLHGEILNFCKEQFEMRDDLNIFRMSVGTVMEESEIREYLNSLKEKYSHYDNIGLEYHIEVTRYDFGVPVICIIKRGTQIHMKKFVYRFRKKSATTSLDGLSINGISDGGKK